ncbi:MAG TPA: hypothetical protein PKC80_06650 [Burkholderiaceae bacterium]|nr:hypothetical protein [Burkholderiaceae bacterium]
MSDTSEASNHAHEQLATPAFRALRITAPNLDAEHALYNALLDELDAATHALESLKILQETHGTQRARKLRPLEQQARQLYAQIVEQLEQRLLNPIGLSKKHLTDIETVVHTFSKVLRSPNNPTPTPTTLTQQVETAGAEEAEQQNFDKTAEREAAKQAHQAKRLQSKSKAKTEAKPAPDLMRTMYRKLASALHPDRASDEAERVRKTALMGQVNAAHDAKDLLSLLHLQLQTQLQAQPSETPAKTTHFGDMHKNQLKQLNQQMQAQIKALQHEWQVTQTHMQTEWDLPYGKISDKTLQMALRKEVQELTSHIAHLQSDVLWLADDAFLKNWLTQWGTE